jgi:subtilisin family serine protease
VRGLKSIAVREQQVRLLDAQAASTRTGRGVRVGVVDSGWNRTRIDARILSGVHVSEAKSQVDSDDHDRNGHGTTCSRIILEMAPECRIVPIRVFEQRLDASPATLMAAIDWAVSDGLKLLNLSLGTLRIDILRSLYATCARARDAGVILVAAARSARDEWSYPAVFEPVIGVGLTALPNPYLIQYRPGAAVECATSATARPAIGTDVVRATPGFGTSYAAPIVTALIARWLEENPQLDTNGVRALMGTR